MFLKGEPGSESSEGKNGACSNDEKSRGNSEDHATFQVLCNTATGESSKLKDEHEFSVRKTESSPIQDNSRGALPSVQSDIAALLAELESVNVEDLLKHKGFSLCGMDFDIIKNGVIDGDYLNESVCPVGKASDIPESLQELSVENKSCEFVAGTSDCNKIEILNTACIDQTATVPSSTLSSTPNEHTLLDDLGLVETELPLGQVNNSAISCEESNSQESLQGSDVHSSCVSNASKAKICSDASLYFLAPINMPIQELPSKGSTVDTNKEFVDYGVLEFAETTDQPSVDLFPDSGTGTSENVHACDDERDTSIPMEVDEQTGESMESQIHTLQKEPIPLTLLTDINSSPISQISCSSDDALGKVCTKPNDDSRQADASEVASFESQSCDVSAESNDISSSNFESIGNSKSAEQNTLSQKHQPVAIIAITTNKDKNVTQILIKTPQGEHIFKKKTSELMQATSNLKPWGAQILRVGGKPLKIFDPSKGPKIGNCLSSSGKKRTLENEKSQANKRLSVAGHKTGMNTASIEYKNDSPTDTSEEGMDEQPITEALSELGIAVDNFCSIKTNGGQKLWLCPQKDCIKSYTRQCELKVHILSHYGIRPFKCDFEGCYWSFYTYFKLKRHKETHLKKKDYFCPIEGCGRSFTTIYNLNTHQKLHDRPADNVCPVDSCGASFQTKRRLEIHMKEHEDHHAPYKCPVESCGKHYYSSNALNSHQRSHQHKEEELKCQYEGCGKLFDKPCRLRAHMRIHTGDKPYLCTYEGCTWSFSSASKLKRHQQKHTNDRRYKCSFGDCTKSFLRSEHLKEHQLSHLGLKSFMCPVENCDVKFTAKSSLYVHLKKHNSMTEKIDYHCPIEQCNRKYLSKSSLRNHLLKFHTPVLEENLQQKVGQDIDGSPDASHLDYIALLTVDEMPGTDSLRYSTDTTTLSNGGMGALNLEQTTIDDCNQAIINASHFMSSDVPLQSVLTPHISAAGTITQVVLSPPDNPNMCMLPGSILSNGGMDLGCVNIPSTTSEQSSLLISRTVTTPIDVDVQSNPETSTGGSARTHYTYDDILREREKKHQQMLQKLKSADLPQDGLCLAAPSDVVLGSGAMSCHESSSVSHNLLLQDDLSAGHDLYHEDNLMTSGPGASEFQVLLLSDSTREEFAESTINLRDLE